METARSDWVKPKNKSLNGGVVKLTPSRQPTFRDDERGDDNALERFETAPESEQDTSASAPVQASAPTPTDRSEEARRQLQRANDSYISTFSTKSVPPPGSVLTGKQEHYLKRELISEQSEWEISELAHPTALQRFGAPFRSDVGEVPPQDSELPLLRFIFVHHVRNFPFLDQAREKEFWQDKLQVFLESFANKHISSSEDRLEDTKRKKLAIKAQKMVKLMMVSGIPTASGYEERIRFEELEVVDRGANESGLLINAPHGHEINGWDVNVAGVRTTTSRRHVRHHTHSEFLLRVKQAGKPEIYVARRFGDFAKMHKRLRSELPGKVLPPLPRKNKSHSLYSSNHDDDSDADSISSASTEASGIGGQAAQPAAGGMRSYLPFGGGGHRRAQSKASPVASPRSSMDAGQVQSPPHQPRGSISSSWFGGGGSPNLSATRTPSVSAASGSGQEPKHVLHREEQRVSLRAALRTLLRNEQIAHTSAMADFLTLTPTELSADELIDVRMRMEMDEKRVEEQKQFYEIARQRARELDVHMEKFRRDIVERNGLTKLFSEIKQKDKIADLSPEYRKFAEWLRIEVAATLYHVFLAEDNSPELFAQAKRVHSLVPYTALKQVIRFANPAAVMSGVLDLFLAQPFGAKSLLQRIFGLALNDGIRSVQKSIDSLVEKIDEPTFCEKIKNYVEADQSVKTIIRAEARSEGVDLVVAVLRSDEIHPELQPPQVEAAFNAYVAWNNAVENIDDQMRQSAELFAHLKQLLKLHTRKRDKTMMLNLIEESTTLRLFRDLFTIFYEPLVRVYKSANVYNSVTDFSRFADDAIQVIEKCQRQDVSADPNQTVQAFIDLCERHEDDFYKFVHEVHLHDNGLFDQLMSWIENILQFLRLGPRNGGKLDMNALFTHAVETKQIDPALATREINQLIRWQEKRKRWHQDKTRQKMAATDNADNTAGGLGIQSSTDPLSSTFKASDFGLNAMDLQDLNDDDDEGGGWDSSSDDEDEDLDPIVAERKRRAKKQDLLRRNAGEPIKPVISEVNKMREGFLGLLRNVLAE